MGISPTSQQVASYSLQAKRYVAQTGTDITLEHANSRLKTEYPPISIPGMGTISLFPTAPYYLSSLSLTISQPLLRNAWGLAKKNAVKISDYSLEIASLKLSEDWEDFIALLRDEYLTWQQCHRNVTIYEDKVKKVEDQLALVKKQKKYGLSEELDLVQIKQKLQAYRIMLEQAKMACDNQTRRISQLMAASVSPVISPEPLVKNKAAMDEGPALSYLRENSNLKQTADIVVAIQKTNLETLENKQLMDVRLVLQAKPNAYADNFSQSLSKIGEYNENMISVNASRYLFNEKAEANAKAAQNEYQKAIEQREEILLQAENGLASLYTSLDYLSRMLDLNQNNLKLAQERLALEKKKFEQGRSSVFFVLQAEDDVLAAENTLNENLFAREGVINQIQSFTDRYLVEYEELLRI
jgi:outer membrane protein TolC